MNLQEVARRMPLKKFDIYGDINGLGHLTYSECYNPRDAGGKSNSFKILYYCKHIDIERAFVEASDIYCNGLRNRTLRSTKASFKVTTKVEIREYCRGRDGGSEWADPENDIIKGGKIRIAIRLDNPGESQQYEVGFSPSYAFYGISKSYTTMVKMSESYLPSKRDAQHIVAFEWRNNVFAEPYIMFDQLCVAGKIIGEWTPVLGEDDEGSRVKVDYLEDYVRFHKMNEIYGLGSRFFLNGNMIFTANHLLSEFPDCSEYGIISNGFYEAEKALEWIKEKYPQAKRIHQTGMGASLSL